MKNLLMSLVILFVSSSYVFAQEGRELQPFVAANGDWQILAPGVMQPDENALKSARKKATYSYKDPDSFFAVSYRELPRMPKHLDRYYNRTRDNAVKGVKGQLIKEIEFTTNGITGREIYVKVNSSIERTRMFFGSEQKVMLFEK